jgi:cellulose synthase/poly-beta-1,6-N-acetylglucosamine synthase-like glycosyltransferase
MIDIIYALVCLVMLVIVLFLYGYTFYALWITRRYQPPDRQDWPQAALVIPCKGMDPDLKGNLRRHFGHDYPEYQIIFTVADPADPAVAVIQEILRAQPGRPATLVIAPRLPDCVDKVSNQIAAFASLDAGIEVIVCADSDGLPRDHFWLKGLVGELRRCTLISGFRWYIPPHRSFVGLLQSAWDANWFLLFAVGKTAWGGAMAFTCDTYKRLRFEEHLRTALTDDLVLQVATHRAGEHTGFTPGSMVISEPAEKFADFYRWAVRQTQMVRLVTPALWLMGLLAAVVFPCFFGLSLAFLLVPVLTWGRTIPALVLAVAVLYYLSRGCLNYQLARFLFPGHSEKTRHLRWAYYWATPLCDLLTPFVVFASLVSNTVRWRGISYRVHRDRVERL